MCFSASASFTASVVLVSLGAIAIKKSTTPGQRVLSCIPVVFGLQQFTEGLLWIGLSRPGYDYLVEPAKYGFLIFAQIVWPAFIPFAIMQVEPVPARRRIMKVLSVFGLLLAAYFAYCLANYNVVVGSGCAHINYILSYPKLAEHAMTFGYFLPAAIPPFISGIRKLRVLGLATLLAYVVAWLFYREYAISVWCFFAALVSSFVLMVIVEMNRKNKTADAIGVKMV
jgi:hypothetical protein